MHCYWYESYQSSANNGYESSIQDVRAIRHHHEQMAADVSRRLGDRLRFLREARGLTQEQLGEKAGITWHFVSSIERGRRGGAMETLAKLAAALDLTLSELFVGIDKPLPREAKRLETALAGKSPETQRRIFRIVAEALDLTDPDPKS